MSLPADLLAQAKMLAASDKKRPRQASLRRAVSTAYYALFHFIGEEASKMFVGASSQARMRRDLARRAIAHTRLKDVCNEFQKRTPRDLLKPYWITTGVAESSDLKTICVNLIELQEARHSADYDFSASVSRLDALDACDKADRAMQAWRTMKDTQPETLEFFAQAILLWPGLAGR